MQRSSVSASSRVPKARGKRLLLGAKRAWAIGLSAGFIASSVFLAPAPAAQKDERAWSAAQQLLRGQKPSGQFDFEYDFLLGGARPATQIGVGKLEYITREAAAAYGLSEYFLRDHDKEVASALSAILANLQKLSLPISKAPGQETLESTGVLRLPFGRYKLHGALQTLGLLYRPVGDGRLVSYDRGYDTAWGGATALALLTELNFHRASHDRRYEKLRQAWLDGLRVLYDGAGFRSLPDTIDENALSNGEIWLALARYARFFPADRKTATLMAHVDGYMLRTYAAKFDHFFYSWGMHAAAERFLATGDVKFAQFIAEQTRQRLAEPRPASEAGDNSCAEIEGLAAALRVLDMPPNRDQALVRRLRSIIDVEMVKNNALQIRPRQDRIDLGHGTYLSSPAVADHAGAFLAGLHQPYLRIDYTAHCICAVLELNDVRN